MAGIGFELKKMFSKKGVFPLIKAYGYAGTVCVGPMLLGMLFLIVIGAMSISFGATEHERELLNSMVTYTLLSSMVLTGILSMVLTRFVADSLYSGNTGAILPSFWGGVSIMLAAGELMYGIFLACAGITAVYAVLCLILFGELVLVWTQMSYLTAVKDYQGIIKIFACSLVLGCIVGAGLILGTWLNVVTSMLVSVTVAYGVRNFEHLEQGYKEMYRVLKRGGVLCVIELSTPRNPFIHALYNFYTRRLIPLFGRSISKDARAYSYLPESIAAVPQGDEMLTIMQRVGFTDCRYRTLTFSTCTIYLGVKP